jgi:hypothetical protein
MYGKGNQVTAPPPPAVYAGDPYYGYYDPFYLAYGYGPVIGFGYGFGGRYYGGYGGGYHGGYGGGYGGFHGGGGGFHR